MPKFLLTHLSMISNKETASKINTPKRNAANAD